MFGETEDSVLLVLVDTSTSLGFDEAKPHIIHTVNEFLKGRTGKIVFFNTGTSEVYTRSYIRESDFDMCGQTRLWDSFGKILEMYPYQNVEIGVYTDCKDTASRLYTRDSVYEMVKTLSWKVTWLLNTPRTSTKEFRKNPCSMYIRYVCSHERVRWDPGWCDATG
jgi:hypothetical protein